MRRRTKAERDARRLMMRPSEVAAFFRVDPKTPARWAAAGLIPSAVTPGGHRLIYRSDVEKIVGGDVLAGKDVLLLAAEVAALFRVDDKTPVRWAVTGKIRSIRTPSGGRRFFQSDVKARLDRNRPVKEVPPK